MEERKTLAQLFWLNIRLASLHSGNRTRNIPMCGVDVRDLLSSDIPHVQVPDVESPTSDSALRTLRDNIDCCLGMTAKKFIAVLFSGLEET